MFHTLLSSHNEMFHSFPRSQFSEAKKPDERFKNCLNERNRKTERDCTVVLAFLVHELIYLMMEVWSSACGFLLSSGVVSGI